MKDYFSKQSQGYAKYRPVYPSSLFEFIFSLVKEKQLAWDVGTGNGQTAAALAAEFSKVFATDISEQQINHAAKADNINYAIEPAEHTSLGNESVNLVTISQALHWFNFPVFYDEVKRVAKPGAIIAAWTYTLLKIDPQTDRLIYDHHYDTLEDYWDAERIYVDEGYANIPFPFKQLTSPDFNIEVNWNLQQLEGYFNTWSALQKFITINGSNPVPALMEQIKKYWPEDETRKIVFPIKLKAGLVH